MRKFFWNIAYLVGFLFLLYWGLYLRHYIQLRASATFDHTNYIIYASIFPVVMGAVLGLPRLINLFKRDGNWKIDWATVIIRIIPTSFLLIQPYAGMILPAFNIPIPPLFVSDTYIAIIGILCGYSITLGIKKSENLLS